MQELIQIMVLQMVVQALIVYAAGVVICESYAFQRFRDVFNWILQKIHLTIISDVGEYEFIACRLCVGFWLTLGVGFILSTPIPMMLAAYGLAIYLESTERR